VTVESPEQLEGGVVGPGGTAAELVGQLQYQSSGDVRSSGAGASVRLQSRRLHGYVNVAYAGARLSERGVTIQGRLPGSPRWLGSGGASFAARDWTASIAAHYVGPERLDPSRPPGGAGDFVEANVRGLYRTRVVYPVTFHVDVLNVFGTTGTVAASPVYAVPRLPVEGRRVLFGAEVRF
jgi:hypothetical protein